jgi:NAD(P)-dependent dehydrogenase (short-subunit alcohol dehydrogenase family)
MSPDAAQVAVITGAASGIGRALAVHYAGRGVHSVIGTFPGDPHDPEETLRQVKDAGGQAVIHERSPSEPSTSTAGSTTRWRTPASCATRPWAR